MRGRKSAKRAKTTVPWFCFVIQDHKSRLEVGGGLGGAIPDGMAGLLLDDMRPALRQNQYGPAFLAAAVERLGSTIAQSKGVTIAAPAAQYRVRPSTRDSIPWPLILFGIFFLLFVAATRRREPLWRVRRRRRWFPGPGCCWAKS